MSKFHYELDTAGHSEGNLVCDSLNSACGDIEGGLGFEFGKQGCWVISFEDFEQLYLFAKAYRTRKQYKPTNIEENYEI